MKNTLRFSWQLGTSVVLSKLHHACESCEDPVNMQILVQELWKKAWVLGDTHADESLT